jgi:P-type conjugative transfer protein TrbG
VEQRVVTHMKTCILVSFCLLAAVGLGAVAIASDDLPETVSQLPLTAPPSPTPSSAGASTSDDLAEPDLDVSIRRALGDADTEYRNILRERAQLPKKAIDSVPSRVTNPLNVPPSPSLEALASQVSELKNKLAVERASMGALQSPHRARVLGAKTMYAYNEAAVYEVTSSVDHITDIQLKPGESLTATPTSGDTVRWSIGIVRSGAAPVEVTHIVVKPLDQDIQTNLVIVTDQHIYQLRLKSSDFHMPVVAWHYPHDKDLHIQAALRRESMQETTISPEALRFSYTISGESYPWRPVRVFDDGQKTFIQMPRDMRTSDAPALFLMEDGSEPILLNYRVKGDFYIVDRLLDVAELRVGPSKHVTIELDRPSWFERNFF